MSGRPRGPVVAAIPLHERVWGDVKVTESGCWEWPHPLSRDGYGTLGVNGRRVRVHRVAYELATGRALVAGEVVRHACDNPPCCNPEHLLAGTQADNVADMMRRGRMNLIPPTPPAYRGERHQNSVLTTAQVIEIRSAKEPNIELAARYGVSDSLISQVKKRKAWSHVP